MNPITIPANSELQKRKISEMLSEMIASWGPNGEFWVKGILIGEQGQSCLLGGAAKASGTCVTELGSGVAPAPGRIDLPMGLVQALAEGLPAHSIEGEFIFLGLKKQALYHRIFRWNDHPDRTFEEVKAHCCAVLKKAIEREEADEATSQ